MTDSHEPRTSLAALEQAMGTLHHEAVTVMAGLRAQGFSVVADSPAAPSKDDTLRAAPSEQERSYVERLARATFARGVAARTRRRSATPTEAAPHTGATSGNVRITNSQCPCSCACCQSGLHYVQVSPASPPPIAATDPTPKETL